MYRSKNFDLAKRRNAIRAKKQLKVWTQFDDDALDFCGRFGVGSIDQIRQFCKYKNRSISENRIKILVRAGFLKTDEITLDRETIKVYMLDRDGKKYCEDISTKPRCSTYSSSKLKHDYRHVQCVFRTFDMEEIKKFYRCENELSPIRDGSSKCDGALVYGDGRNTIYIETLTQHYKAEHIKAKQLYVKQNNSDCKFFNVRV